MPHSEPNSEPLLRQLTAVGIWIIVMNGLIGAGIFGVPAEAARLTGIYSPLVFLLCGILMLPIVLSFGEVSSYFHGTGGPILYTRTAFGEMAGFQSGWALYVSRVTAFGANANLLVSAFAYFWDPADEGLLRILFLFLICGLLTWVNVVGVRHAMRSLGVLTILKIAPLVLLVVIGLPMLDTGSFAFADTPLPARTDIGTAALILMYAYVGFEGALIPAGEAKNPARDMPRALFWSLGLVTVLYVAIQAVSVALVPELSKSDRPVVELGVALLGNTGGQIIAAAVIASVGGNIAAAMLSAPRMTYVMARHGTLPAWFGVVDRRYSTPARSVIVYGVAGFALAVYGSFAWLAGLTVLVRLLVYIMSIATIPHLRRHRSDAPERLRLPGGYTVPLMAIAVCAWLLAQVSARAFLVTGVFVVVGVVLFLVARRQTGQNRA